MGNWKGPREVARLRELYDETDVDRNNAWTRVGVLKDEVARLQAERDKLREMVDRYFRCITDQVDRLRRMATKIENAQEIVQEVRRVLPVDDELRGKLLTAETLLCFARVDVEKAVESDD